MELESQRIKDVLKDTKYENKYVNSLFAKQEDLSQITQLSLNKRKKEIESIESYILK